LIQEKNLERVNVIALSDLDSSVQKANNSLANFVRSKEGFEVCKNFWLNAIEVCETDNELFVLRESQKVMGVSRHTKLVSHKNGSWSAGKQLTQGIFARKREMEELAIVCEELKNNVDALNTAREQCLQDLKSQENLQNEVKQELSSLHIQSVSHRKEKESLEQELRRIEQEKSSLSQKTSSLQIQIETLNADLQLSSDKLIEKQAKNATVRMY
jgi:chromosome segregation ATPase